MSGPFSFNQLSYVLVYRFLAIVSIVFNTIYLNGRNYVCMWSVKLTWLNYRLLNALVKTSLQSIAATTTAPYRIPRPGGCSCFPPDEAARRQYLPRLRSPQILCRTPRVNQLVNDELLLKLVLHCEYARQKQNNSFI